MRIRKQIYEITLEDLLQFPVWEFALDEEADEGQDESTVRPYKSKRPVDPRSGMFAVKALFALADGSTKIGFLTPPADGINDISVVQPVIVTEHGQVMFWYGAFAPGTHVLTEYYRRLGKTALEVFPITFRTEVSMLGGPIEGTISAFVHFHYNGERFFTRTPEAQRRLK